MDPMSPLKAEDLSNLSDEELVRLYCGTPRNQDAFAVLWLRCEPTIRERAAGYAREHPEHLGEQMFYEFVLDEVTQNFLNRICGFEYREAFSHFVSVLIKNAAID